MAMNGAVPEKERHSTVEGVVSETWIGIVVSAARVCRLIYIVPVRIDARIPLSQDCLLLGSRMESMDEERGKRTPLRIIGS
jgi:hypothetical protein